MRDIDFDIYYAVKDTHNFNKIWRKVGGSKETLSTHLSWLIEDDVIEKRIKKGKSEYWLSNNKKNYEDADKWLKLTELDFLELNKKHKKISNEELLHRFVNEAVHLLKQDSIFQIQEIDPFRGYHLNSIVKRKRRVITNYLKTQLDILDDRNNDLPPDADYDLTWMYLDMVERRIMK